MIFGLSLLQLFLVVLVIALAVVGAEQIRTHLINPALTTARRWLSTTEAKVVGEFEAVLHHTKTTAALLPPGSTIETSTGNSAVTITTPKLPANPDASLPPAADEASRTRLSVKPLVASDAVKRYFAGGMSFEHGMPTLDELLYLFALTPANRVAWGMTAAATFATLLTSPFEAVTLGDLGAIRPEAAAYLNEIATGYPIVGTTSWTKA